MKHTPKAFLRGRNQAKRPHSTYLNLRNARLLEAAIRRREEWDQMIKANGLTMKNPITHFPYLHPTRGWRTEWF
ncbi:MAG: hypothetical protein RIA09_16235 [Hoeflea sp.]|jgi:hypothetical protein|uniref:hypothetical protein n=1 Tax=Hoeflea sp. TaxID=1940281 RepID=UPI0032EBFBFC